MTAETPDESSEELVVRYQPVDADRELLVDLSGWAGTVELRAAFAQALRHVTDRSEPGSGRPLSPRRCGR